MPVPKFYRVLRGQRGTEARSKYLAYLERLSPTFDESKIGSGQSRPERVLLYLDPFGLDLGTTVLYQSSALLPSWQAVQGIGPVSTRVAQALPTGKIAIKPRGGQAARVNASTVSATGTKSSSHLTGLTYLKYNSNSISFPFGRLNDTETMGEAFAIIKAAMPPIYKRVYLVEENI